MNSRHLFALFATISFSSIQCAAAQNQVQEQATENSYPIVAKVFDPIPQSVNIDCGNRQFIFHNDQKNQKLELTLINQQGQTKHMLTASALSALMWDTSRFDSVNYLCAERGISLLFEGYHHTKESGLLLSSQKIFISNQGVVTTEKNSNDHADVLTLARRGGSTGFLNSLTQNGSYTAQFHGPWQPINIEINQTIECNPRLFTLSYLPFYRNLNSTVNLNAETHRRDVSSQVLQKILENRGFYSRVTYACIKDGYAIRFQGLAKTYANNVEPLTITLNQNFYGKTSDYHQVDELQVTKDAAPLRGEIQITKAPWKTTRQYIDETRVVPSKPASKPSTNNK